MDKTSLPLNFHDSTRPLLPANLDIADNITILPKSKSTVDYNLQIPLLKKAERS